MRTSHDAGGLSLLKDASEKLSVSARAYHRVPKWPGRWPISTLANRRTASISICLFVIASGTRKAGPRQHFKESRVMMILHIAWHKAGANIIQVEMWKL